MITYSLAILIGLQACTPSIPKVGGEEDTGDTSAEVGEESGSDVGVELPCTFDREHSPEVWGGYLEGYHTTTPGGPTLTHGHTFRAEWYREGQADDGEGAIEEGWYEGYQAIEGGVTNTPYVIVAFEAEDCRLTVY